MHACRATTAAPTLYDSQSNDGIEHVDGATVANNPIENVWHEATSLWGSDPADKVVVSIGTGSADGSFEGNLFKVALGLKKIIAETDRTGERFEKSQMDLVGRDRFARFTVEALRDIGLDEYGRLDAIKALTNSFLSREEVKRKLERIAKMLRGDLTDSAIDLGLGQKSK